MKREFTRPPQLEIRGPGAFEESRFKAAASLYPVGTSIAGCQEPARVEYRLQNRVLFIYFSMLNVAGVSCFNRVWWNLTASNK